MANKNPIERQLQEIHASRDFARLAPFSCATSWATMTQNERQLLAMLFIAHGEEQLKHGDNAAIKNFSLATEVAPSNPQILFHQAQAYASQVSNSRCLASACNALELATQIDPNYFAAWHLWGTVLMRMGEVHGEIQYFQEAGQKFTTTQSLLQHASNDQKHALYWDWGLCWHGQGMLSGEALDLHCALDKYRFVAEGGFHHANFWNDYGTAMATLAGLLGRKELLIEAIDLFQKVVTSSPNHFQGWLNLACACYRFYEFDGDDAYFYCACDSFSHAAALNSNNIDLWINWGRLFVHAGKLTEEFEHFTIASEKFEHANACEPNQPELLCAWAEADMLSGDFLERLDLLRSSQAKIVRSLELQSDNPESWYIYGCCLLQLGRYFTDSSYFLQAIEKYRYGLTLNERHPRLWHGLAMAYFSIGEMDDNAEQISLSADYCAKAIENGGQSCIAIWNDWGVSLMKLSQIKDDQGAVEAAIDKFEQSLGSKNLKEQLESPHLDWLYHYGCAYDFLGDFTENPTDYEKAVQILSHVVQQDPEFTSARCNLAIALSHLGEVADDIESFHKALEHFQIYLSTDSEDENAWNSWGMCLLNLAQLMHDPLHPEQSLSLYEQAEGKFAHAIALGSSLALYNMACLYSMIGNHNAAMHYIERSEVADSLPPVDELMHDEWLESLRETAEFRNFIALISNKKSDPK